MHSPYCGDKRKDVFKTALSPTQNIPLPPLPVL